jgi:hypothetical protein
MLMKIKEKFICGPCGGLECGGSSYRLPVSVRTAKLARPEVEKAVAAATALQDVLGSSGG